MVAIEHRSKSSNTTTSTSILSPTSNSSVNSAATSVTSTTSLSTKSTTTLTVNKKMSTEPETSTSASKSAVSQRQVDAKVSKKSHKDKDAAGAAAAAAAGGGAAANNKEESKKALKLDLKGKETDLESLKSPKSPIGGRLTHQTSLSSSVDVEDRKTLREALYQGIFHRHRRTIFAFGSFLRMLRSRNPQYNSIRSASEGEAEVEEVR